MGNCFSKIVCKENNNVYLYSSRSLSSSTLELIEQYETIQRNSRELTNSTYLNSSYLE